MTLDEFTDNFHRYVACMMDKDGFRFAPLHAVDRSGDLTAAMIDLPPKQIYQYFWSIVTGMEKSIERPEFVILGLDRSTRPGQGTEFADVLTCVCWWDDPEINWGRSFRTGVINYQYEPRVVRPWDWNNAFWNAIITNEATAH